MYYDKNKSLNTYCIYIVLNGILLHDLLVLVNKLYNSLGMELVDVEIIVAFMLALRVQRTGIFLRSYVE